MDQDNVFVKVVVSVMYQVIPTEAYNAHYTLANPRDQITSYVFDVVRSNIPKLTLDETFASKEHLASAVRDQLATTMESYGYAIHKVVATSRTAFALLFFVAVY